jgi:hypothetical protein
MWDLGFMRSILRLGLRFGFSVGIFDRGVVIVGSGPWKTVSILQDVIVRNTYGVKLNVVDRGDAHHLL